MCTGQTLTLTGRTVHPGCARTEGARDAVFPFRSFPRAPLVSHIFSIAGSNTGAEREVSQGRIFLRRVAVGAKRRALTGLPRSVHSPAKKWEITRSRPVFPARRFSSVRPLVSLPSLLDPQPIHRRAYRVLRCK